FSMALQKQKNLPPPSPSNWHAIGHYVNLPRFVTSGLPAVAAMAQGLEIGPVVVIRLGPIHMVDLGGLCGSANLQTVLAQGVALQLQQSDLAPPRVVQAG